MEDQGCAAAWLVILRCDVCEQTFMDRMSHAVRSSTIPKLDGEKIRRAHKTTARVGWKGKTPSRSQQTQLILSPLKDRQPILEEWPEAYIERKREARQRLVQSLSASILV